AIFFFVVAGRDFLTLWMGESLAEPAYPVLALLGGAQLFSIAQQPGAAILKGVGAVRPLAYLYIGEAAAHLVLSLVPVRSMGLAGVALGTVVPLAISNGILMPILACRVLGVSIAAYVRDAILPTILPSAAAFVLGTTALRALGPVRTWGGIA